nr:MAG TPA: hypothetical protein [Caudoviricetes sp.]
MLLTTQLLPFICQKPHFAKKFMSFPFHFAFLSFTTKTSIWIQ